MGACVVLAAILIMPLGQAPEGANSPPGGVLEPDASWATLGRSLWFDRKGNRVIVHARVVLREGVLEHLLCLKGTKEHEAILATDAIASQIHAGLLLTGARPGHPVRFEPKFEPPAGSPIGMEVMWRQDGKMQRSDIRQWVRDDKTKMPLGIDWVFAGSYLYEDPATKKTHYAADEGDMITVANFGSAFLDLPIASSASDADRVYVTNTEKIPPLGTEVFLALRPRDVKLGDKPGDVAKPRP